MLTAPALSASRRGVRNFAKSSQKSFELRNEPLYHLIDGPKVLTVGATKEQLLSYHKDMFTIRRMEISCDQEYKNRLIRGFCHLSDGQEAVAVGLQAALSKDDHVTSSYRCHGLQYIRGDSVHNIVAELFGFVEGSTKGKGGSMHFYSKKNKFWGGAGIVGAQVPVAVGLALAEKYRSNGNTPMNVSVGMYGDGASNQGQLFEAVNMAKIMNLPAIYLCENNQYGMGTSTNRSSHNIEYYKHGGVKIPGVQADGLDVLAVREAVAFCKEYAANGNGPIYLELKTYRYHGHSMSDPGISYRSRDEVTECRQTRDCIDQNKDRLISAGWATEEEIKALEKKVKESVAAEVEQAKKGHLPPFEHLYKDVYVEGPGKMVRMPDYTKSIRF